MLDEVDEAHPMIRCPECRYKLCNDSDAYGKVTCSNCLSAYVRSASGIRAKERVRTYDPPYKRKKGGVRVNKGPLSVPVPTEVYIAACSCMHCGKPVTTINSAKARMFKGYHETVVEGKSADPTTGVGVMMTRVFPTFQVGRVALDCLKQLKIILHPRKLDDDTYSTSPKESDEVELIAEKFNEGTLRAVTKRLVEMEDDAEDAVGEDEAAKYLRHRTGVRVKLSEPYVPPDPCPVCDGRGKVHSSLGIFTLTCETCYGSGKNPLLTKEG